MKISRTVSGFLMLFAFTISLLLLFKSIILSGFIINSIGWGFTVSFFLVCLYCRSNTDAKDNKKKYPNNKYRFLITGRTMDGFFSGFVFIITSFLLCASACKEEIFLIIFCSMFLGYIVGCLYCGSKKEFAELKGNSYE